MMACEVNQARGRTRYSCIGSAEKHVMKQNNLELVLLPR